jgi:hypothetical protein
VFEKASFSSILRYGWRHPKAVYNFLLEYKRMRQNKDHPFDRGGNLNAFENYSDFVEFLLGQSALGLMEGKVYDGLVNSYQNVIKRLEKVYGDANKFSVLSLEESLAVYLSIRMLRPEIVLETGVSDGVSSLFIIFALEENKIGHLYSIDFPDVGMPGLYGLDPGWIVPEKFREMWELVYGKSEERLMPLLKKIGQVDVFLHDSEHSYRNMLFEFSSVLKFMNDGSLLLSDDVRANNAFLEAIGSRDFSSRVALLTGRGSDLGGVVVGKLS